MCIQCFQLNYSVKICGLKVFSHSTDPDFSFPTLANIKPHHLGFNRTSFTGEAIGSGKAEWDSEKGVSFGVQEMWVRVLAGQLQAL